MALFSHTIFLDAFSRMKVLYFDQNFTGLFLRVQFTKNNIGLDNGWAPNKREAIIRTNADPIHWRIFATLLGDELSEIASWLSGN